MPSKMHSNKRLFGSFHLKTLNAAVALALLFSNAQAAGLGKLTVLSSLGQPLRAEIELTSVSRDEAGALAAKLASLDAFRQANIDFNSALTSLHFSVEQRGERQFIRVTSAQPLNEPFVDMLLELSGPNGRLVREYTFLLDPADLRTAQSAQVAPAPVPEASAARAPQASAPSTPVPAAEVPALARKAAPSRAARVAIPRGASAEAQSGEYKVRNGDSLAKIASQVKPAGVSLDQMLVALFQSNPDAFAGNNMNRLKAGQILSVPSEDTARAVNGAEAHSMIVAQAADFNNYRARLAGKIADGAAQKSAESKQSAGGKITAKVEERPTVASESKDKLKLSNSMTAPGGNADKAAAEDKIAKEKALAEANSRVKELEKNVGDLQKLLEVKNKSLADQQKQADAVKTAEKPAAPAVAAAPVTSEPAPAPAPAAAEKPAETNTEKPVAPPVASAPPAVKPKPKPVAPPPPPPEPSFLDSLTENPLMLPGVGALLVALGAFGIYRARRQKQSKPFEDSLITDSSLKANSLFGSTGGQSVDTNNSVFNSSFAPSASQLDTNEVDPVAEADVYIAYGRDAQAEEILKEALRTQPDRHAVRVKLLEIYSNRKDLRAFEVLATELYGLTKGEGEDWAQAAALGIAIDPSNPLYASGKSDKGDSDAGVMVAPTQPLDEQGLATLLSTTQSDTSSMDTISALEPDTSYFTNTALAAETPLEPVPEAMEEPKAEAESEPAEPKASSNDLDFDLEGMNLPEVAVPNTVPRPVPAEPPAELASIDFNFLDEPPVTLAEPAIEPVAEVTPEPALELTPQVEPQPEPQPSSAAIPEIPEIQDLEFSLDPIPETPVKEPEANDISLDIGTPAADIPSLEINIPGLDESPAVAEEVPALPEVKAEPAISDPLEFDLSGISLELNPAGSDAKPDLDFALPTGDSASDDDNVSAEMATKLDLAIAYQEIGDKEGARELLDEVLKGGTPEQSERAKSLLLELA
jgi:pilus assembly protein FimV